MIGLALLVVPCLSFAGRDPSDSNPEPGRDPASQQATPPPRPDGPRAATEEGFAFVELSASRREYYLHQLVPLRLRFGIEEGFLAERAVQPFRQRLEVPVRIVAPWLDAPRGGHGLGLAEAILRTDEGQGSTFALNEDVRRAVRVADRILDDRRFRVFEIEASLLPTRVGELEIPAPVLALAYATRFEETLLDQRIPVDRMDVSVSGEPLALSILPLPEAGRPFEFTGAVGHLSVRADVRQREVQPGETLMLELTIEGPGNLSWFDAPSWSEIGPFRVLGVLDEKTPDARILTFALAPYSEKVWQIPAIAFVYFDPGPPAAYRTARTEPIDVVVRAQSFGDPSFEVDRPSSEMPSPGPRRRLWRSAAAVAVLLFIALLVSYRRAPK